MSKPFDLNNWLDYYDRLYSASKVSRPDEVAWTDGLEYKNEAKRQRHLELLNIYESQSKSLFKIEGDDN